VIKVRSGSKVWLPEESLLRPGLCRLSVAKTEGEEEGDEKPGSKKSKITCFCSYVEARHTS
jgi:hypothetical protein